MALNLKLPKVFGKDKAAAAAAADLDMPTTQVRASQAQSGYDPLASVSIMEQLRTASTDMKMPKRLPLLGHLPIVQQFQVLGVMMVMFFVFAAFMVFLDGRIATQNAAAASTATEMQMLSQRLARGTALAAQGQAGAFASIKCATDCSRRPTKADI